jgi:small subunit ribosomal protein S2
MPGALVIVDVRKEVTAINEARKLGIKTICLLDTDGDPDMADIAIPGNDDSMRAIDVIIRELCLAVADGKQVRELRQASGQGGEGGDGAQRRSRRAQFKRDDAEEERPAGAADPAPAQAT